MSAPLCIYYRLYDLKKSVQLIVAYPVQLAEQAKISISYLSKIEATGCDKSLSISVLNQIANVLGVEIMEFFKEV